MYSNISRTEGKGCPTLKCKAMSAAIANGLVKFVESQDITLNYSDKIAPPNGMGLWKTSVPISRESPVGLAACS